MAARELKSFSEQVDILTERGCVITEREEAEVFLSYVSYYRLSGYFLPFKNLDDTYNSGVSFERIAAIYEFGHRLRTLLYRVIGDAEISARTAVSYVHARRYGEYGYMDAANYTAPLHDHEKFAKQFSDSVNNNSKSPIVKHHNNAYGGKFPLWAAVEFFTLGMLSHFCSHLHSRVRGDIAAFYGTKAEYLGSWLQCVTVLRNFCAHYQRLYFTNFTITPKLTKGCAVYNSHKIFAQLIALKLFYKNSPISG